MQGCAALLPMLVGTVSVALGAHIVACNFRTALLVAVVIRVCRFLELDGFYFSFNVVCLLFGCQVLPIWSIVSLLRS